MGYKKGFSVTRARKGRHVLRHEIGGQPRNLSPNARSFTGQNGNRLPFALPLRVGLASGAKTFNSLDFQREVRRVGFHWSPPFVPLSQKSHYASVTSAN